jgi:ABC-type polysaccharide/polyol phosphate export permease
MTIYTPQYRCHVGTLSAVKALWQQAKEYRWQIWLAIKKNIKQTYQQDVFGLFWSVVMPIIPMTIYIVLAHIKVFKTVHDMPFVYYIAMGMLVWLLMATTIHAILLSIKAEKAILTTTTFPVFPAILSRLGEVLHDTTIRLVVVALIVVWYNVDATFTKVFLALLSLFPAIIFALGVGMILALLDLVVQDTRRVVLLGLRYGLFVSSVIFPFPEEGWAGFINKFNIFNTYVNATRDLLYFGYIEDSALYLYTSLSSIFIFMLAAKLVYSMDFKIREFL